MALSLRQGERASSNFSLEILCCWWMDWWQTEVFSEPRQDIWGTTGAQRLMDLSLSNFRQEEQWRGCIVLHAYIVHMFRWRSGFEIYDVPLRCLHISQTTSYHHLISALCEMRWDEMRWGPNGLEPSHFQSVQMWQMGLHYHFSHARSHIWSYSDHQLQMKLVCTSVLFFFFLLRCPGELSLFGVPHWSWI